MLAVVRSENGDESAAKKQRLDIVEAQSGFGQLTVTKDVSCSLMLRTTVELQLRRQLQLEQQVSFALGYFPLYLPMSSYIFDNPCRGLCLSNSAVSHSTSYSGSR